MTDTSFKPEFVREFRRKHGMTPRDPKKMAHHHEKKGVVCPACDMQGRINKMPKFRTCPRCIGAMTVAEGPCPECVDSPSQGLYRGLVPLEQQQRQALIAAKATEFAEEFLADAAFVARLLRLKPVVSEVDTVFAEVERQIKKKNPAFSEKDIDVLSSLLLSDDIKDTIAFVRTLVRESERTIKALAKMKTKLAKRGVR